MVTEFLYLFIVKDMILLITKLLKSNKEKEEYFSFYLIRSFTTASNSIESNGYVKA